MSYKLSWDDTGKKFYETGVDHGVLYPQNNDGSYPKALQSHLQEQIRMIFTQITSSI